MQGSVVACRLAGKYARYMQSFSTTSSSERELLALDCENFEFFESTFWTVARTSERCVKDFQILLLVIASKKYKDSKNA